MSILRWQKKIEPMAKQSKEHGKKRVDPMAK
jgi:hypothetical protein